MARTSNLTLAEINWVEAGTNGVLQLAEQASSPTAVVGYGLFYVKTSDGDPYFMDSAGVETNILTASSGAPIGATYVTLSTNASLTNERVLTGTSNQVTLTDNGAGSTVVLSLPQDIATNSSVTFGNITLGTGGALRTGTTAGNTLLLQAYDNDTGPGYITFATLTAGNTPTFDLNTATTIGSAYIYRAGGTDIPVTDGGTGLSAISALSVWVANSANTITEVTPGAGNSIRINAGGTAWEAFTPSAIVPTSITVANEATDTTCFPLFVTAATGDLAPKTNAGLAFNSNTGMLTATGFSGPLTGNASTATALQTARTIGGTSFDGTANITVATATGGFTVSGGDLAIGANSLTITGSIAATGARVTKGWFTDLESTNMPTVGGTAILTSLTTPQFTTIELGHATQNTLSASGGILSIEGVAIPTISSTDELSNKTLNASVGKGIWTASGTWTLPAITAGGVITLAENSSVAYDPALSADGKYTGITVTGTAGTTLAFGDLVYLDPTDSRWELCDANAAAGADGDSRGILGLCVLAAASDGSATTILLHGVISAATAFPAITVNAPYYVSETAGDITGTQPTTTDAVIRVVGFGIAGDDIFFNPSGDYITHT